jgi:hypothetical protein
LPIRKVVPFEFIYPLAKFGNFWRIKSATFGIFKLKLVEILEKWIFQFGLGLSLVLQYRPKPIRTAGPSAIFPYACACASFRPRQLQLRPVPSAPHGLHAQAMPLLHVRQFLPPLSAASLRREARLLPPLLSASLCSLLRMHAAPIGRGSPRSEHHGCCAWRAWGSPPSWASLKPMQSYREGHGSWHHPPFSLAH